MHHTMSPETWPQDQSRASFSESMRQRHAPCETAAAGARVLAAFEFIQHDAERINVRAGIDVERVVAGF